jgi:hypothetical protein
VFHFLSHVDRRPEYLELSASLHRRRARPRTDANLQLPIEFNTEFMEGRERSSPELHNLLCLLGWLIYVSDRCPLSSSLNNALSVIITSSAVDDPYHCGKRTLRN